MTGRGGRDRTRDLVFWRHALYQLSYTPKPPLFYFLCGGSFVSLWTVTLRSNGQNFFNSTFSVVFVAFFLE